MAKLIIGSLLNIAGVLLILFRRPLLEWLAGGTRVKLGLFFGVDRVHTALCTMTVLGLVFILTGICLIYFWLRRRTQGRPAVG